jgi:hypothetical protein
MELLWIVVLTFLVFLSYRIPDEPESHDIA